jgi:hypothetical protein
MVAAFHQNLLVSLDSTLVLQSTSRQPAAVALHRPVLTLSPQLHDYSTEHRMLFRLAKATWPSGKLLHCSTSAEI